MKKKQPEYIDLETVVVLAFVSLLCTLFFKVKVLLYVSLCLLFVGIFLKKITAKIANIWLTAAHALGTINTKILLSVVYFIVLVPIAYFYRLTHGDVMAIRWKNGTTLTSWNVRNYPYEAKDLEKLW